MGGASRKEKWVAVHHKRMEIFVQVDGAFGEEERDSYCWNEKDLRQMLGKGFC